MKNITQWEHFKKNYLNTFAVLIAMFITVLILEIVRNSETWGISFFFLGLALSLFVGNYYSWKKKLKNKQRNNP